MVDNRLLVLHALVGRIANHSILHSDPCWRARANTSACHQAPDSAGAAIQLRKHLSKQVHNWIIAYGKDSVKPRRTLGLAQRVLEQRQFLAENAGPNGIDLRQMLVEHAPYIGLNARGERTGL